MKSAKFWDKPFIRYKPGLAAYCCCNRTYTKVYSALTPQEALEGFLAAEPRHSAYSFAFPFTVELARIFEPGITRLELIKRAWRAYRQKKGG